MLTTCLSGDRQRGNELKTVESGVYLGAILRADESVSLSGVGSFEAPEEVDQEVGKSTPFERADSRRSP